MFEACSKESEKVAKEYAETMALNDASSASTGDSGSASTELSTREHELARLRKEIDTDELARLRKEIETLKNQKHGIRRRSSKKKPKDAQRLLEIENEISAKTKRRDELYQSVGRKAGIQLQHTHAAQAFEKKNVAMRRGLQAISKNNENGDDLAEEMTAAFHCLGADNSIMGAKRQRLQ